MDPLRPNEDLHPINQTPLRRLPPALPPSPLPLSHSATLALATARFYALTISGTASYCSRGQLQSLMLSSLTQDLNQQCV